GLLGVVIVLWPKLGMIGGGVTAATLAASLISVLGMAAGTIWQKRFASGGDLVSATMWQYVGGSVLTIVGALAFETRAITVNGELIFAFAWLVLVLDRK
ncbi:EamA/RhaT family transporter, partial [bacterium M00.F.Ca.ET.146.01.1.1]